MSALMKHTATDKDTVIKFLIHSCLIQDVHYKLQFKNDFSCNLQRPIYTMSPLIQQGRLLHQSTPGHH